MLKKSITKQKFSSFIHNKSYWRNVLLATLVSIPILLLNLTILHNSQVYISDDVIQQNILQQWEVEPRHAIVGEDSFILKLPFYFVLSKLVTNSPGSIYLTAFIFILIAILFLNLFQFIYHKDIRLGILLSLLIVSYGGVFLFSLRTPNLRNLEITLAILTAWIVHHIIFNYRSTPKYLIGILSLFAAFQASNDPYVFYVLFLPTIVVTYMISNDRVKHLAIVSFWGVTYLLWHAINYAIESFGLSLHKQPIHINPSNFIEDTVAVAKNVILIIGNWQIYGSKKVALITFIILTATALVAILLILKNKDSLIRLYDKNPTRFWPLVYGVMIFVFCVALYVISGMVDGTSNIRYAICAPFALVITLIGVRAVGIKSSILAYLLIMAIVVNLATNLFWYSKQKPVNQLINYSVIEDFSQNNNVSIGFADYWDGNINTYYANGKFKVIPIVCSNIAIKMLPWATNLSKYPSSFNEPTRFFIFLNAERDNPNRGPYSTSSCNLADINMFFGDKITLVKHIDSQKTLVLVDN